MRDWLVAVQRFFKEVNSLTPVWSIELWVDFSIVEPRVYNRVVKVFIPSRIFIFEKDLLDLLEKADAFETLLVHLFDFRRLWRLLRNNEEFVEI